VNMIAGMRCVSVPATIRARRSLRERLFSWPWRPKLTTKMVPNPSCPPDGMTWLVGDTYYGSEATIAMMRRCVQAERKNPGSMGLGSGSVQ
jgi:hypothetical protein